MTGYKDTYREQTNKRKLVIFIILNSNCPFIDIINPINQLMVVKH